MDLTHLGHSCLLVETGDQRVLVDPGTFSHFEDVRDVTAIMVTHQHPDHCDPQRVAALLAANPDAELYAEPQAIEQVAALRERALPLAPGQVVELGGGTVEAVGERHAVIHPYIERIDNRGLVFRADGEPTLLHPGDALDAEVAGAVDLLCVPLNAPWQALKETIAFVRRLEPAAVVPIHDGLLSDDGRGIYLPQLTRFGKDGGVEVLDLRGAGRTHV